MELEEQRAERFPGVLSQLLFAVFFLGGLYYISRQNFLVFHTLMELFSIAVVWSVFVLVWTNRRMLRNDPLFFLGLAYFFVGFIDLAHTLAYKGMGILATAEEANRSAQLWLAGRTMESISLVLFVVLIGRSMPPFSIAFGVMALLTAAVCAGILVWDVFPAAYMDWSGVTGFALWGEYAVCVLLAAALALLVRKRLQLDAGLYRLMAASIVLTMAGEIALVSNVSVHDLSNVLGHCLKIGSFFLVYLALVRYSVTRPFSLLFAQLTREQKALGRNQAVHQARMRLIRKSASGSVDELVTMAIDEVEQLTNSRIGFFQTLDADENTLTLQGWSTRTVQTMCGVSAKGTHFNVGAGGVWVDCIRQRAGVIHNDYQTLPHRKGYPTGHVEVVRELVVPVFRDEHIVAIMGVGNKPVAYNDADLEYASKLADLLWDILNRKWAEDALVQSEGKWRNILRHTPQIGVSLDLQGRVLFVNDFLLRMTGWKEEEILGCDWFETFIPEEQREHVRKLLAGIMSPDRGQPYSTAENEILTRGGERHAISWANVLTFDAQGQPLDMTCLGVDLTERKHAEATLLESRNLFRSLVNNLPLSIMTFDSQGIINFVNQYHIDNIGRGRLGREHYLDRPVSTLTGVVSAGIGPELARVFEGSRVTLPDVFVPGLSGGGSAWQRVTGIPLMKGGRVAGGILMREDITERKLADEAIRTSESRLALALEATSDGLWDWSRSSGQTYFSPHCYTMFGYDPGEFEPSHATWSELVHADDVTRLLETLARSMEQTRPFEIEFRVMRKSGEWQWTLGRGRVMAANEQGQAMRMVGTLVDITERKLAEQELTNARDVAEAASRAKSEFLANMSHEIRTPLNGIMGMLQLIQGTRLDSEQIEYSEMALQASSRLTRLLSDILDLSRVEAGQMTIRSEAFVLRDVLTQCMDMFAPTALQTGVELSHHFDATLPAMVLGDPVRLQQVLTNLLGNAFKFTQHGSVSTEAYLLPAVRENQVRVFFSITDTGCGIPDEALGNLFKPFAQVTEGYSRQYQGAGLGLAICKRLVRLMGGNMAICSEVGVGTSMYFCVSFEQVLASPLSAAEGLQVPERQAWKVLVVEDDEVNSFAIRKLLLKNGHSVTSAGNGQEALQRYAEQVFDLILMDVQMPVMDGVEATRTIRRTEQARGGWRVPVIAMTAYAMQGDGEKFLRSGMDGYLAKPFGIDDLIRVMHEVKSRSVSLPQSVSQ